MEDILWPHFKQLWEDLKNLDESDSILIAGGYGLYLKQQYLLENQDEAIVVSLARWGDTAPRVTNDLDFVLGLDLIASESANRMVLGVLESNEFAVTSRKIGQRWQFVKQVDDTRKVLAELHAPTPDKGAPNLKTEEIRVKRKPKLGEQGIHGRHNKEAVGCELYPYQFEVDSTALLVPNPVTWAVMKLTAMHDCWNNSKDPKKSSRDRSFFRAQAEKHAQDACRTVAMTTIAENDQSVSIVEGISNTDAYANVKQIFISCFEDDKWAPALVAGNWQSEDFELIYSILKGWFN